MGDKSKIEWTDATWNPWMGCHKVSQGCKNCYMFREQMAYGHDPTVVRRGKTTFEAPLKWKEPRRIFPCSWSDWFIPEADAWRPEAWEIIRRTPQHTYQILTKRPELIPDRLPDDWGAGWPNVWLGVSAEDQEQADKRVPVLLRTPADVRFVSAEPLLGNLQLHKLSYKTKWHWDTLSGFQWEDYYIDYQSGTAHIDWVIAGGESGPGARPMHPDWARSLRDQCQAAEVAFFFKQWGEWAPEYPQGVNMANREMEYQHGHTFYRVGKKLAGRELDGREWNEFPGELR